jgi:hypothetical protein
MVLVAGKQARVLRVAHDLGKDDFEKPLDSMTQTTEPGGRPGRCRAVVEAPPGSKLRFRSLASCTDCGAGFRRSEQ